MEFPKGLENYGADRLRKAVQCMREACDQADREINSDGSDLGRAKAVLHTFIWAWANAQMNVEACLSHVERWSTIKPDRLSS